MLKTQLKVLAILVVMLLGAPLFAAEGQEMKEYIGDEWPSEIKQIFDTTPVGPVSQRFFSSKGADVPDYAMVDYVSSDENYYAYILEDIVEIRVMYAVKQKQDEKGVVVRDENGAIIYEGKMAAVVLYKLHLAWYQSAEVKEIFLKAIQ